MFCCCLGLSIFPFQRLSLWKKSKQDLQGHYLIMQLVSNNREKYPDKFLSQLQWRRIGMAERGGKPKLRSFLVINMRKQLERWLAQYVCLQMAVC